MTPLLLALPLMLAAPVPKDFKKPTDADRIVGRWEIVASNRHERPNPGGIGIVYEFQKDGACVIVHQDKSRHPIMYSLDPTGTPKTYRWICPWGRWHGVYELNGDTLKIAAVGETHALPPSPRSGPGIQYSELRRLK